MGFLSFDMAYEFQYNKFSFDVYHLKTYNERFGDHILEGEICIIPQHFSGIKDGVRTFKNKVNGRYYVLHMSIDDIDLDLVRKIISKIEIMNFDSLSKFCIDTGDKGGFSNVVYQKTINFRCV